MATHIERLMNQQILWCKNIQMNSHPTVYPYYLSRLILLGVYLPNVWYESIPSDGGLMSTKPYISSSNYILKMKLTTKDKWCEIWDSTILELYG